MVVEKQQTNKQNKKVIHECYTPTKHRPQTIDSPFAELA